MLLHSNTPGSVRRLAGWCALAAGLVVSPLPVVAADGPEAAKPIAIPRGPAKPGFDISRFIPAPQDEFQTFQVTETKLVRDALKAKLIAEDTALLVTETGAGTLALLLEQMAYHHLAQGRSAGKDWLVSFCIVCNTGTRLVPAVEGMPARFVPVGVYDAMLVIADVGTGTLWNHITGEAMYGRGVGSSLGPVGNVLQMNVKQALAMDPAIRIAISSRAYIAGGRVHAGGQSRALTADEQAAVGQGQRRPHPEARLSEAFASTLGSEDGRRPRMDLGLGVWTGTTTRYYPVDLLRRNGSAIVDSFDGRRLLVYIDPETSKPAAMFVSAAEATLEGTMVRLDNGQAVEAGVIAGSRGERQSPERPLQLFTRWYGFALTFPDTEVFGQDH